MQYDMERLRRLEDLGLLALKRDPESPLLLANYTPKAQYTNAWAEHPLLLDTRGTLLLPDGTVWAKPFRKFFTLEQSALSLHRLCAQETPEITQKLDGSMVTLYLDPGTGRVRFATRGSFHSAQAAAAEALWAGAPPPPDADHLTYIFEYTAPDNRIVVHYPAPRLTLLGQVDTATGWELALAQYAGTLPVVETESDLLLLTTPRDNFEGYVLFWPKTQLRLKVKLAEYVRLHRLLTGVNARSIWEELRYGRPLTPFLERVPDEFYAWVKETTLALQQAYHAREYVAQRKARTARLLPTRKEQALSLATDPDRALVFLMLDGRSYKDQLWDALKPERTRPFQEEVA